MSDKANSVSKKYFQTVLAMIVMLGAILGGFWYFVFGLEQIWIPALIILISALVLRYIVKPQLESILENLYAKKK